MIGAGLIGSGGALAQEASPQKRLIRAIRMGDSEAAKKALAEGADPNTDAGQLGTPIAAAIWYGDLQVVQALVENGADLKKASTGGWPPLKLTLFQQAVSPELVGYLLEHGEKPNGDEHERSAYLSSPGAVRNLRITTLLLSAGCKADGVTSNGWPVISFAAAHGEPEVVEALIKAGAHADASGEIRSLPIVLAARRRDSHAGAVIKALVTGGAKVDERDDQEWTALTMAASAGSAEAIRTLVQAGAGLEVPGASGMTPLDCASAYADAKTVRLLLDLGARPDAANTNGQRPLELALDAADLDHGPGSPAEHLSRVSRSETIEKVRALLDAGADPNVVLSNGWTPLMLTAYLWDMARVGHRSADDEDASREWQVLKVPLEEFAATHDPADIVRLLASKGAKRQPAESESNEIDIAAQRADGRREALMALLRSLPEDPALAARVAQRKSSATKPPKPRF
jgi:ankyrin repeat protein